MELTCTKKLLEYLGAKPEKASGQTDPLFQWTANLTVINRRKTLVVVHAASRCAFVLYGITAKDKKKLPELILNGIRRMLESEYVRPEIAEQYLDDLGREVLLRANSSPKTVASCNKVCQRINYLWEFLQPGELFQEHILPWLNYNIIAARDYQYSYEALLEQLQQRYGEDIRSCRALELEVSLELNMPCKRRIIVPANLNFHQFHNILQECFGWKDRHLHQFVIDSDADGYPTKIILPVWGEAEDLPGVELENSAEVTLESIFATRKRILYEYDFGDSWIHCIELCRIIDDCRNPYPHCIMALGVAPIEDCGGPEGFEQLMAALNDPEHPEHHTLSQWAQKIWCQPPDVNRLNLLLKNVHRHIFSGR